MEHYILITGTGNVKAISVSFLKIAIELGSGMMGWKEWIVYLSCYFFLLVRSKMFSKTAQKVLFCFVFTLLLSEGESCYFHCCLGDDVPHSTSTHNMTACTQYQLQFYVGLSFRQVLLPESLSLCLLWWKRFPKGWRGNMQSAAIYSIGTPWDQMKYGNLRMMSLQATMWGLLKVPCFDFLKIVQCAQHL